MPLDITTIPCLSDNYAFLAVCSETGATALFDVPEAEPIAKVLADRNLTLDMVFLTHHHADHVAGLDAIKSNAKVIGAAADQERLPPLDRNVIEGDTIKIGASSATVMDVSGHTVGHIAYYVADSQAAFTGDSLMAMGCGRIFEGTPEMMWASLSKLAGLPADTMIYSGHEYTAANAVFAKTVDPENLKLDRRLQDITAKRADNIPTVPSLLRDELSTNPFLRSISSAVRQTLNMQDASDLEVFTQVRVLKDNF
ncbi:MAG: hydroxyacylglutathione hydrolase [Pseudomonadota bacterium]